MPHLEARERGLLHARIGVQQLPRDRGAHGCGSGRGAQARHPRERRQPAAHVLPPGPASPGRTDDYQGRPMLEKDF